VIRLQIEARSYEEDLDSVVRKTRGARRAVLLACKETSLSKSREYCSCAPGARCLRSGLDQRAREEFLRCWDRPPQRVKQIKLHVRNAIPQAHRHRCPYCRLESDVSDLDHVLEKATMPELVFLYRNLVPTCGTCNTLRATMFDSAGVQRVIHFYDDEVDDFPDVLQATLCVGARGPAANFFLASPLPHQARLYASHFSSLQLERRYREWAAGAMVEAADWLKVLDEADAGSQLEKRAEFFAARWGRNEPATALYRALAANAEALEWLLRH
jgi:hypothetical protein